MCAHMSVDIVQIMHKRTSLLLVIAFLTILIVALAYVSTRSPAPTGRKGLRIAVTFYALKPDVDLLLCTGDEVFSVTLSGIDPHEYQLTPADVAKLRDADLIISTAHAPFELNIAELVKSGELRAKLLEIPSIEGLRILKNPETGNPNYHWPIYDPQNYMTYVGALAQLLSTLRPECRDAYLSKAATQISNLSSIVKNAPRLNATAIGATPEVQYAVNWLGINVSFLLIKEHDLPATPKDIAQASVLLSRREVSLIVAPEDILDTSIGVKLKELSSTYNVPLLVVPSPTNPKSTYDKIVMVAESVRALHR